MKYAIAIALALASFGCEHKVKLEQPITGTAPGPTTATYDAKAGGVWITGETARARASDAIYCAVEDGKPRCVSISAQ